MEAIKNITQNITDLNDLGTTINYFNSFTSKDPIQKEIANNRIYCTNKFTWYKLKQIFYIIILPCIFLILFAMISSILPIPSAIYFMCIIWIILGFFYLIYLQSIKWNYIQYKINTYDNINKTNCEF
jgi:uncharacterized membrane protein YfhO